MPLSTIPRTIVEGRSNNYTRGTIKERNEGISSATPHTTKGLGEKSGQFGLDELQAMGAFVGNSRSNKTRNTN